MRIVLFTYSEATNLYIASHALNWDVNLIVFSLGYALWAKQYGLQNDTF